jgi:cyclohexa-1,5-dienecarbonyl-CoA hydratase
LEIDDWGLTISMKMLLCGQNRRCCHPDDRRERDLATTSRNARLHGQIPRRGAPRNDGCRRVSADQENAYMNDSELLALEVADGIATVTLNRPPVNVMHIPMMAEFNSLLETVLADANLAAIVLRANGKAFCAGVDVADHTADKVGEMIRQFHGIFRKLAATDALTIAVVNGAALGGGCELATFCDIVLASERAKFGQPEVQVGAFPPVAACALPYQIGIRKAVELNVIGMTIDANEAQRIGLVSRVYPVDEFDERVEDYLEQVRKLSRPVVRMAKRATAEVAREQFLSRLEHVERLYLDELMKLSDAHEGIAAFVAKRAPNWKHA